MLPEDSEWPAQGLPNVYVPSLKLCPIQKSELTKNVTSFRMYYLPRISELWPWIPSFLSPCEELLTEDIKLLAQGPLQNNLKQNPSWLFPLLRVNSHILSPLIILISRSKSRFLYDSVLTRRCFEKKQIPKSQQLIQVLKANFLINNMLFCIWPNKCTHVILYSTNKHQKQSIQKKSN